MAVPMASPLLPPNGQWTVIQGLEADLDPEQGYHVAASMVPPPPPRPQLPLNQEISTASRRRAPKAQTKSKDEWEAYRDNIHRLYVDENLPLKQMMKVMGDTYDFHAS